MKDTLDIKDTCPICQGQGLGFVSSDKLLVDILLDAFSLGIKLELFWQIIYYSNQTSVLINILNVNE